MLTAFPLPAAAADDDPALTQIAGLKNDRFTVEAKKLGYTALNGECPARPEWATMPEYSEDEWILMGKEPYKNDDEWWKDAWKESLPELSDEDEHYYEVSNSGGYAVIKEKYAYNPVGGGKVCIMNADGSFCYKTAVSGITMFNGLLNYDKGMLSFQDKNPYFSNGTLSGGNAFYANTMTGKVYRFDLGTTMVNGVACVLDIIDDNQKLRDLYEWEVRQNDMELVLGEDLVSHANFTLSCNLSLINNSGEKIFTVSEPLELKRGYVGGWFETEYGYNYQMNLGGYSENLVWFECDRQMGATLNDLIENTGSDKDGETDGKSNRYQFAEHQCGFADLQGNIVIPQKFDFVSPFYDGIAMVGIYEDDPYNLKCGFIDKTGNYIVEPQYYCDSRSSGTGSFSEGFARVALQDGTSEEGAPILKYGYIDKTGKVAIELQFEDARDFKNGFACVKKDGKWGYINTVGETVIPFEYSEAYGSDGLSFVAGKDVDGATKFGAIDADGNTILPFIFEDMSNPVNGLVYAFCNKELYSMEIAEILDSGDLTGDGDISIDDAQTALKAYTEKLSGKDSGLTPGQLKAADINGDGQLSVEDVQYILIYYTENKVAGKHMTWEDVLNR